MILIGMYFGGKKYFWSLSSTNISDRYVFVGDGAWSPRVITCFGKTFFDVALTRDRCEDHNIFVIKRNICCQMAPSLGLVARRGRGGQPLHIRDHSF